MTTIQKESPPELRQHAEERARLEQTITGQNMSSQETEKLLHELRVHQIELQMQVEELHQKQFELDKARARYFYLYDLAPVGYLTFNKNGLIQEANLAAANLLWVKRETLIHNVMSRFILDEEQDIYYLHRKKMIDSGEMRSWEMQLLRADNTPFWALLQATPTHDGEYLITFTDIDERKRLEEEKLILLQQFQQTQKLESLGLLSGGISHDFNNILQIILGNCSLAKLHPEKAEKYIQPIENAAERAADLCRQMLAYAGKATRIPTVFKMSDLLDEMVKMLKATISQNVIIKTKYSEHLPVVKADATQIRQIIMNLIINAAEAIDEAQGEIHVSLSVTEIKAAHPVFDFSGKAIPVGEYICLEVSDNGCGMNEETKHHIFEPFYTTKFTGRGLGMSAVLGIITSHAGALQFESELGQGSTFKIYLPVQVVDLAETEPLQDIASAHWQGSGTVLFVEDEVQLRLVVKAMLKRLGFTVIEASNGQEALELYQINRSEITLVLTDMGMPVMDGYRLFRELKKYDPDLPIVISSGFGDCVVTEQIPTEKIAGLISKPYRFDKLREVIKNVIETYIKD